MLHDFPEVQNSFKTPYFWTYLKDVLVAWLKPLLSGCCRVSCWRKKSGKLTSLRLSVVPSWFASVIESGLELADDIPSSSSSQQSTWRSGSVKLINLSSLLLLHVRQKCRGSKLKQKLKYYLTTNLKLKFLEIWWPSLAGIIGSWWERRIRLCRRIVDTCCSLLM